MRIREVRVVKSALSVVYEAVGFCGETQQGMIEQVTDNHRGS